MRDKIESGIKKVNVFNGNLGSIVKLIGPVFLIGAVIITLGITNYKVTQNEKENENQSLISEQIMDKLTTLEIQISNDVSEFKIEVATDMSELKTNMFWTMQSVKDIAEQMRENE